MSKPTAQQCHALTTYYATAAEKSLGKRVAVSRNKARWWFESILMDYSPSEARELIDYYIEHYEPNLEWFAYNYDRVDEEKREHEKNEEVSRRRREVTAQRLEGWRKRWNKTES